MPPPIRLCNLTTEHMSATGRHFNFNSGRILKKCTSNDTTANDTEDHSRTMITGNVRTAASLEMKEAYGQYGTGRLKPYENIHGFEIDHSDEGKVSSTNYFLLNCLFLLFKYYSFIVLMFSKRLNISYLLLIT